MVYLRHISLIAGVPISNLFANMGFDERLSDYILSEAEEGVFSQALAFPVVPREQARLRVMVSAAHTKADLDEALSGFEKAGKALCII